MLIDLKYITAKNRQLNIVSILSSYSSEKHIYSIDIKFEKEILEEGIMNLKFKIPTSSI